MTSGGSLRSVSTRVKLSSFFFYLAFLLLPATSASAQNVTSTLPAGSGPFAVAVNPITNKVYISNSGGASVTMIDGATNLTKTIPVGKGPLGIAVNTVTNKIYVANEQDGTVSVIDGASDTVVATPPAGNLPSFVAVNPLTNSIYICNVGGDSVSVINGGTDTVIATVIGPNSANLGLLGALAVNPATNKIYVVSIPVSGPSSLAVIDGASNAMTGTVLVGNTSTSPFQTVIAVNPISNKIYVANVADNTVSVVDGSSDSVLATVPVGNAPEGLAVNPVTNRVYVTNLFPNSSNSNFVTIIDGVNDKALAAVPTSVPSSAPVVNVVTNQVYVVATGLNPKSITVIDGATNSTTTVTVGNAPSGVAVNPITNKVYVANQNDATVSVIDGATNNATSVATGNLPQSVAVNPVTGQVFVANGSDNTVAVIQGPANATTLVSVGTKPEAAAVNPVTNQAYVVNQGDGSNPSTMTVIDGNNLNNTSTVPVGVSPLGVAVNSVTNRIYVANSGSNNVMVVDGAVNSVIATIPVGQDPQAMAVNPVTNQIYVCNTVDGTVTAIDGATNKTTTITLGPPPTVVASVAVNPVTNLIYVSYLLVQNGQSGVLLGIIDGSTNTLQVSIVLGTETLPSPQLVVNPTTNKVYIANSPNSGSLVVLNATGNILVAAVNIGQAPLGMALNPATNKIYVTDTSSGNLTVIDGISNTVFTIPLGARSSGVAVNPVTGRVYVTHELSDISVVADQQVNPIPLAVQQISPVSFSGVSTQDRNPVFAFAASTSFQPFSLPMANVFYQVDTWQGLWLPATGLGSNFSAQLSHLSLGDHILYAYATDGQDSSLYEGNSITSPIAAYPFTVVQSGSSTALAVSANPATFGQSVTVTAAVSSPATQVPTPTGSITFMDGSSVLGTISLDGTGTATFATAAFTTGVHNITAVYSGDVNFTGSSSSALLEIDNPAATTTAIVASGSSAIYGSAVTLTATVSSTGGTPAGPVTFVDASTVLGAVALNARGQATLTTASLAAGIHNITAAYAGSLNFSGSTSAAAALNVAQAGSSVAISSSSNPATVGTSLIFTATVTSATSGVPAGSVTFVDGSSTLGTAPLNAAGIAALTVSTLSAGSHSIIANYSGSTNFAASASAALAQTVTTNNASQIVLNFPQGSQTVTAGGSANYNFTVSAPATLSAPVSFGCIGLPQGATCAFSPQTVNPGGSGVQVALKISTTARSSASLSGPETQRPFATPYLVGFVFAAPAALLLCMQKRKHLVLLRTVAFAWLLSLLLLLPGCGGTPSITTVNNGSVGTPNGTFTLGVIASSGSAQTIAPITLVVQ